MPILAASCAVFVNGSIDLLPFFRIGFVKVLFIEIRDFIQMRLLFLVVEGAEILGTLKEHVFQIVRDAGRVCGVMLATSTDRDFRVESWFFTVFGEVRRLSRCPTYKSQPPSGHLGLVR